jgi:tyrosine-protein phosphatase YwqE
MIRNIEKIPGYTIDENGNVFSSRGKKVYTKIKYNGYLVVKFGDRRKSGNTKQYLVHRLVAEAFLENPNNKPFVNHKDRNKKNNNVSNLEWVNSIENNIHWVLDESNLIQGIKEIIESLPDNFLAKDLYPLIESFIKKSHIEK